MMLIEGNEASMLRKYSYRGHFIWSKVRNGDARNKTHPGYEWSVQLAGESIHGRKITYTKKASKAYIDKLRENHPALVLFKELFEKEVASGTNPNDPAYYVSRCPFHKVCRSKGIAVPDNFIEATKWEEEIGLTEFAFKIVQAHRELHDTSIKSRRLIT
ncbi:MAG TPA: hypothetical protein VGZ93_03405 [Candidatus Methylacidiphilales bacterium]|nr:hypothetical protein [Candidatus Methylacidiphilales bacterium]